MRLRGYGYGVKVLEQSPAQPGALSWGLAVAVLSAAAGLVVAEGIIRQ